MRVALAQALFVSPSILLLDEPTNHLDLGACVWLENYLSTYPRCLLVISHSQDFLNGVCSHIMHLDQKRHVPRDKATRALATAQATAQAAVHVQALMRVQAPARRPRDPLPAPAPSASAPALLRAR